MPGWSKTIVLVPAPDPFFPDPTSWKERCAMSNRNQFLPQFAAVLVACGLIPSLLPGFAAAQDGAGKPLVTGKGSPTCP
jgi:hypothetical protein